MGLIRVLFRLLGALTRGRRRRSNVIYLYERRAAVAGVIGNPDARTPLATLHVRHETIRGKCHVVDGDTIIIDNRMIRLAGIDAPELDQPYGEKAKWALVNLCKGHVVEARTDGQDHYDRTVATCHLADGRDLSAEMVKCGMALDWPKFSGGRYRALEPEGIRQRLWRVDARQKGRFPPTPKA